MGIAAVEGADTAQQFRDVCDGQIGSEFVFDFLLLFVLLQGFSLSCYRKTRVDLRL